MASPKNIILCSDGTGNAGGKTKGTNVWRLYEALDLSDGDQNAFHDDGVGTSDNPFLRALGGAVGWGLGANVCDLYTSLVRVYNEGDRLYLFGFSRGAYTARSLAGLITRFGILDRHNFATPHALDAAIAQLYGYYEDKDPRQNEFRNWIKKDGLNWFPGAVEFLGVWDTVDAIGVPFPGMREKLRNRDLLPTHNHDLNRRIRHACHALSIDDQRDSFEPTMFDEGKAGDECPMGEETDSLEWEKCSVEQVWFAGVHSNVGGSYPKDGMSYVPLSWMMARLKDIENPLKFIPDEESRYADMANAFGKLYDSRAGTAAFYRIRVRDIEKLCAEDGCDVKIHESVLDRIERRTGGYAPTNIPEKFEIIPWNAVKGAGARGSMIAAANGAGKPVAVDGNKERATMTRAASVFDYKRFILYRVLLGLIALTVLVLIALPILVLAILPAFGVSVWSPLVAIMTSWTHGVVGAVAALWGAHLSLKEIVSILLLDILWEALRGPFPAFVGAALALGWYSKHYYREGARGLSAIGWRYQRVMAGKQQRGGLAPHRLKEHGELEETIGKLGGNICAARTWQWGRVGKRSLAIYLALIGLGIGNVAVDIWNSVP